MEEFRKEKNESIIEGRNVVIEAFRSGQSVDRLYILDGCQDGPIMTIKREARKHDVVIKYVSKERLDQISETGRHQGVIATIAAYEYSEVEDMLALAKEKNEPPFLFLLDNIEDPHNLGAIIRTANLAGAHGVIIPKSRTYCNGSENLCRSIKLYEGGACDQYGTDHRRTEAAGLMVCVCGYGWRNDV